METENIYFGRRRKRRRKSWQILGKRKYFVCGGEEKWRRKRKKIFDEGKGGKYLEKENIFIVEGRKTDKEKEEIF